MRIISLNFLQILVFFMSFFKLFLQLMMFIFSVRQIILKCFNSRVIGDSLLDFQFHLLLVFDQSLSQLLLLVNDLFLLVAKSILIAEFSLEVIDQCLVVLLVIQLLFELLFALHQQIVMLV